MDPLQAAVAVIAIVGIVALRGLTRKNGRRAPRTRPPRDTRSRFPQQHPRAYPGDFTGRVAVEYSPLADGKADPGEIVWTWVPYEEDHSRGKDRPVLLIGRDGHWLLGLQLSSQDHDKDAADEARYGRRWIDIGSGPWDRKGRPSEVRLDRVVRVDPSAVRREGAILERKLFTKVTDSL